MTKKVELAVFDKDLKARTVGKFPLSKDGTKIKVRTGGKRNFSPSFDHSSYIEFPYRSLVTPWRISWKRVYFVRNAASECVNFHRTPEGFTEVPQPDPEIVMEAAEAAILKGIGKDKQETPMILYIILAAVAITLLKVLGVIA